jgi:PKD repeat protein
MYVPATGVWDSIPHCPAKGVGCNAVAFVLNGKAYVGTGGVQDAPSSQTFDPVPDFWCYNPNTNTWDSITPFGGGPRMGAIAFVTCGHAYVGTGCIDNGQSIYANDIWAFDPNGGPIGPNGPMGSWTRVSDFSGTSRTYAGAFVIGTHAYICGGGQPGNGNLTYGDIWEYTPTPAFKFNSPVCQNVQVQLVDTSLFFPEYWAWSIRGGTPDTSNADSVNVIYSTPGTYSVTLTAWNDCDTGTITYTDSIVVNTGGTLSIIATPANNVICNGQTATLSVAGGGANLIWQSAASIIDSSITNDTVTITPSATTVYTVSGPGSGGCAYFGTDTVTVKSSYPFTVLPLDTAFCSGQSAILYVDSGGSNFIWTPINGITDSTLSGGDSVAIAPLATTTYTVTGINPSGCATSGTDVVTIIASPGTPTFTQDRDTLISSSAHDNQWYRNDTLLKDDTSQHLVINTPGEYYVVVTNEVNGCSTSSDSLQIKTGINQLSVIASQLSIYPNPFNNTIFIKINSSARDISDWNLQITDVLGRTIYAKTLLDHNNEINLSAFANGVYFITVVNETGKAVIPVVKQN